MNSVIRFCHHSISAGHRVINLVKIKSVVRIREGDSTECHRSIDLIFVIDGSNSLGETNFVIILNAVSNAVDSLVIGPNDTRVGAVVYSTYVSDYIDLQTDVNAFKTGVLTFDYPEATTATNLGIRKAVDILMSDKRNVPMRMIIITDGESSERPHLTQTLHRLLIESEPPPLQRGHHVIWTGRLEVGAVTA
ncbi:Matrilin-3 [Bulinus truncatus]|nr:Matrilin-3 [Bulinus truncatus]